MNERETLKLIRDKWEVKVKCDKSRVKVINAVFLQLPCRDKKNYYNTQGKKIKGNNKKGKRGGLYQRFKK